MNILQFSELPNEIPNDAMVSINTTNVTPMTHGFHKYPGKFIPQIPRWAVKNYTKYPKSKILDPFVGSGTTLVEATILGHDSFGVDIDPLSCLISKVKSTPIDTKQFSIISKWVIDNMEDVKPEFMPETDNISHWFTDEAIMKLRKIRTLIDMIPEKYKEIENIEDQYDAFIIAFSGIIRRVSNADNQSQKTYVSGTKIKKPAEVYSLFKNQTYLFLKGLKKLRKKWNGESKSVIYNTDGESSFPEELDNKIDLIVTSPPYIKSIDYVYNQMVELFWVGDLFSMDTQPRQNIRRRKYLGSTMVLKKQYGGFFAEDRNLGVDLLNSKLQMILEDDKNGEKHGYIVYDYFKFMSKHLTEAYKTLKTNSYYIMTVGNSSVSNVSIPTDEILVQLAEKEGFKLEKRWSYLIKNHFMGFDRKNRGGKINTDHVLIFKKVK